MGCGPSDGAIDGEAEDDARDEEEDDAAPTVLAWPTARHVVVDAGQAGQEDNGDNGDPEELEEGHLCFRMRVHDASCGLKGFDWGLTQSRYIALCCLPHHILTASVQFFVWYK